MNIKVENLGALKTAETDLSKNLIVYSGKNNSGKTYMLNLVYGLIDFFKLYIEERPLLLSQKLDLQTNVTELHQTGKTKLLVSSLFDRQIINNFISFFNEVALKVYFAATIRPPIISFELNEDIINFKYKNRFFYSYCQPPYIVIELHSDSSNQITRYFFGISILNVFSKILGFNAHTIFFTAERVASLMFGRDIYKYKAKQNLENVDNSKNKNGIPDYPSSILDELGFINNFDMNRGQISDYSYLADELETLIGGKIAANQDGLLLFKEGRTSYLVTNSSSTVKSLATLVFYLRHTAQKGDCIIIDEPELSLHPDNQRKIARFLARCVNEGFKVIISTHSDYIINEINNLITLHKHKDKPRTKSIMKKYDYKANQTLDYQQVGAYLFKDNHCTKIEVSETGFAVETIDEAMGNLYKASDSIFQDFEVENTKLEPSNNNKDE